MYEESTQGRLLSAAVECVRLGGLPAATSRAIAASAGANLGAITYYFGSKDELLAQALLGMVREQLAPVLAILAGQEGDARSRMLAAVAALLSGFETVRADAPAYLEAVANAPRFPALSAGLGQLLAELSHFLADQVAAEQTAGHLPRWIDPAATAGLLIAVAHGIVLTAVINPGGSDPRAMAAQFAALMVAVAPLT